MNPRLHGAERNTAGLGNLAVGHTGHFLEQESFPFRGAETAKGGIEVCPEKEPFVLGGGRRCGAGAGKELGQPPAAPGAPESVLGTSDRDPAKPGAHRPLAAVGPRPPEGAQEGFLGSVFGGGPVSEKGERHGANAGFGAAHEFIEGGPVAFAAEAKKEGALFGVLEDPVRPLVFSRGPGSLGPGGRKGSAVLRIGVIGRKTRRTGVVVRAAEGQGGPAV